MTDQTAPSGDLTTEPQRIKPARPLWILPAVLAIVGLIVGAGGVAALTVPVLSAATSELETAQADLKRTESELTTRTSERDSAQRYLSDARAELTTRARELDEREKALAGRETAVQATEERIAANSFRDGMHVVGVDIQPGTYRATGTDGCYWERLRGASGDSGDRITNDIGSGDRLVTIRESDYAFTSNRCGTWTKQ